MTGMGGAPRAALSLVAAAVVAALTAGCHGKRERNWDPDPPPPANLPKPVAVHRAAATAHPRIVFTAETRKGLRAAVKAQTPWWKQLEHRCSIFEGGDISAGYLGLQWADGIGSLTTCYYATGQEHYRDRAVFYLRALLNDGRDVGDGKGGNDIVHGNSGYPIRAYGVYAALGFDWLHDAPGMDALRPVIIKRLDAWLSWYTAKGYLNDSVYSNYYWGYFTTLALAGLATDGEAAQAEDWLARTRHLLDKDIIPGFYSRLAGGEWAEGWQYGQLVAMEVSLVVDAFYTATGADYAKSFPWIADLVPAQLFRMHPDYRTSYGNGTEADQPPPSDPSGLADAILVLRRTDPQAAARARFIVHHLMRPHRNERLWFAVAADGAGGKQVDPRDPSVLSYHLPGPGQTFMRSSWDPSAVWVSFQAGARIAIDHQHNDQGHFTLWRGSDPLIGEFDREQGYGTINHNSLLIDDGGKVLTYPPNQGVWARNSRTLRWHDTGRAVVVVGDLADAWAPHCVERGCSERAVRKEIRTLVYLRPNVVVTDDDLTLDDGSSGATWEAHVKVQPRLGVARGLRAAPAAASAVVGGSRVNMVAIEPAGGTLRAPAEPTTDDRAHLQGRRAQGLGLAGRVRHPAGQTEPAHPGVDAGGGGG